VTNRFFDRFDFKFRALLDLSR